MSSKYKILPKIGVLFCLLLFGCGDGSTEAVPLKPENGEKVSEEAPALPMNYTVSLPEKKEETVSVKADAYGSPKEITVEAVLSGIAGNDYVQDRTILREIRNLEGAEEFYQPEEGVLVWDNLGEDIRYKGTADAPLPAEVRVTYRLDGNEIDAEELAGKSGHVTLRFDYENHTSVSQMTDGITYQLPVPFAAITLVPMSDHFENVTVKNGKVISLSGSDAAVGFALPGVFDSLKLQNYEVTKEMEIPEYVEIEADVTDFELGFTTTIFTSGIFEELEEEDLDDVNELTDDMNKLSDASDKLVDGTAKLYDGMKEFEDYLNQYNDGISKVGDGISALSDGLSTLDGYSKDLNAGAKGLSDGLNQLNAGVKQLDISALIPSDPTPEQAEFLRKVQQAQADLPEQIAALNTALTTLNGASEKLQEFYTSAGSYHDSLKDAGEKLAALKQNYQRFEDTEKIVLAKFSEDDDQRQAVTEMFNYYDTTLPGAINDAVGLIGSLPDVPEYDQGKVNEAVTAFGASLNQINTDIAILSQYLQMIQQGASSIQGLPEMVKGLQDGISALASGSAKLSEGLSAYTDGVGKVHEGAEKLREGAGQLPDAGSALNEGYRTILSGVWDLSDGMKKFDREGIRELTKLGGSQLQDLVRRIKALRGIDASYDNYSGIPEGVEGSVRFMIETEEIKNNSEE